MSLTKEQICIYIIFLILIIIIVLKYNYNYVYDYYANLEPFTTTQDQQSAIDAIDIMSKLLFNKYNNLNIPINIANNNAICDVWGAKNIENANNNNCIKLPNSNDMQCLNNNSITSCSNYYQDGVINNYNDNSANIELLKTAVKTYVVNNTLSTVNDLEAKNRSLETKFNGILIKIHDEILYNKELRERPEVPGMYMGGLNQTNTRKSRNPRISRKTRNPRNSRKSRNPRNSRKSIKY